MHQVFVISDLHVGGVYPAGETPGDRGFRMCTQTERLREFVAALAAGPTCELVINGDFIDFLAETGEGGWLPFVADPVEAWHRFDAIVTRDAPLFAALGELVRRGHRLVLLLGNHDLELSLPAVRRRLERLLGGPFRFVYDGEAYLVGDALIEHGNRYDGFNTVDHDALRRVRSLQSRRLPVTPEFAFEAPVGSRLVAEVMNPIKRDYPFVDLLKPEDEAVVPILLALEPGYRRLLDTLVARKIEAARHDPIAPAWPAFVGEVAADGGGEGVAAVQDVASAGQVAGLARLLVARRGPELEARLPALLQALRALQADRSTDPTVETQACYLEAARRLAAGGFRYVVFGHTHLAKSVDLGGATYLNTGTWADLIFFPRDLLDDPDPLPRLRAFCEDLAARRFDAWITRKPTYVRLDLGDDGRVSAATLAEYRGGDPRG